ADLQSHTLSSYDGLASEAENLAWHTAAGINVVALTEHAHVATTPGAKEAGRAASAPPPAVILGTELRCNRTGAHLLGLGLQPDYQYECPTYSVDPTFTSRFAAYVHEQHRGAIIAIAYKL